MKPFIDMTMDPLSKSTLYLVRDSQNHIVCSTHNLATAKKTLQTLLDTLEMERDRKRFKN